jgi:hypothetical protein
MVTFCMFWGILPILLPDIVCLSAQAFQCPVNIDSQPRFLLISCIVLERKPRSENLSMCQLPRMLKIERWKLTKFPHCFLKIGWWEPYILILLALLWSPKLHALTVRYHACHDTGCEIHCQRGSRASDRGRIGVFYHDMRLVHKVWSQMAWQFPHDHFQCISRKIPNPSIDGRRHQSVKMYLITLKVFKICLKFLGPITKVNEGASNTPCPSTLEVTYSYSSGWKII